MGASPFGAWRCFAPPLPERTSPSVRADSARQGRLIAHAATEAPARHCWEDGRVSTPEPTSEAFYDAVGGHETFRALVDGFYAGVEQDPVLRPMYPEADLAGAAERLTMFLEQYWGGPTTYSQRRGHPRLRMRHAPFPVDPDARDRWLAHMRRALERLELDPVLEAELWAYLERAAYSLVNTMEQP